MQSILPKGTAALPGLSLGTLKLSYKGWILALVPLASSAVVILSLYFLFVQADREREAESRACQATELTELNGNGVFYRAMLVYFYVESKSPRAAAGVIEMAAESSRHYTELRKLLNDDPYALTIIDRLELVDKRSMGVVELVKESVDRHYAEDPVAVHLVNLREENQSCIEQMNSDNSALLQEVHRLTDKFHLAVQSTRMHINSILIATVVANIWLSLFLSRYFTRGIVKRLATTQDNARRLKNREPLNPPLSRGDEISDLDRTFRLMADSLQQSALRQRAALDNANDVICAIDKNYCFTEVGKASTKRWGYQPEELIGTSLLPIVDADLREQTEASVKKAFEQGGKFNFENRLTRKDGKTIDVSWSTSASQPDQLLFCVAHDVTERKSTEKLRQENEDRLRRIMEHTPVGMLVVKPEGEIEYANRAFLSMTEYEEKDLIGGSIGQLFEASSQSNQSNQSYVVEQLSAAVSDGKFETAITAKTGTKIPTEVSASEVSMRSEKRLVIVVVDITDRQELERLKAEFVAAVSRDLTVPLNSLHNTLTLAQSGAFGSLGKESEKVLALSDREVERLMQLIGDLLRLEKVEAGKQFEINIESVSLRDLISDSVEAVRQLAREKQVNIGDHAPEITVDCDGARIKQVLINLLSNAIKFSPAQTQVTISVATDDAAVRVSVKDEGRGVPAAFQSTIFEKFRQVEREDATRLQGSGLGLPICKTIVESHGGEIGIISQEGAGSTFWFTLKLKSQT